MPVGILILDTTTVYYDSRYACYSAEPALRKVSERRALAKHEPENSFRRTVKPISYVLRTTNRWIVCNVLIPPNSTRGCAFSRVLRTRSVRKCYYDIDKTVRYCIYTALDNRPPVIINLPRFLNWPEVPRTFYLDCEVFTYVDIVPESVVVILERVDKNIIKKFSIHTTPNDIVVEKDSRRPGIYRIICYFREIFDLGERLRVYIDLHTLHGISIVQ